ncbi:MAG TPA: ATP synthase F1 subunit delta [Blastocatellia bacterium]|nr:ATP synthase F1 subunit delta [Blastocatellia bacterium]
MSVTAVARRYAEALADVAIKHNQAGEVEAELSQFVGMFESNKQLTGIFANPVVSRADKLKVLNALIDRTRPTPTTQHLLRLLLSHFRLHHLGIISSRFQQEMNKRRGIVPVEITTAAAVGEAQETLLTQKLRLMTGNEVQLHFKLDPSIIGGAVTRIGSVVYDGSIRTRLETIKNRMKTGGDTAAGPGD